MRGLKEGVHPPEGEIERSGGGWSSYDHTVASLAGPTACPDSSHDQMQSRVTDLDPVMTEVSDFQSR